EPVGERLAFRPGYVECEAAFAVIEPDEIAGEAVGEAIVAAREIACAPALDLDDASAQVGEVATAQGCGHCLLERNDLDPGQRQLVIHSTTTISLSRSMAGES